MRTLPLVALVLWLMMVRTMLLPLFSPLSTVRCCSPHCTPFSLAFATPLCCALFPQQRWATHPGQLVCRSMNLSVPCHTTFPACVVNSSLLLGNIHGCIMSIGLFIIEIIDSCCCWLHSLNGCESSNSNCFTSFTSLRVLTDIHLVSLNTHQI